MSGTPFAVRDAAHLIEKAERALPWYVLHEDRTSVAKQVMGELERLWEIKTWGDLSLVASKESDDYVRTSWSMDADAILLVVSQQMVVRTR